MSRLSDILLPNSKNVQHDATCPGCGRKKVNLYKQVDTWLCRKCSVKTGLNSIYGFSNMTKTLYVCDPNKNKECSKANCAHNPDSAQPICRHTINKEYAMTPKLIKTWEELKECTSETHYLDIGEGCGWIFRKDGKKDELGIYLSTHTFYEKSHLESTRILQECGFNVEIANWDEIGW